MKTRNKTLTSKIDEAIQIAIDINEPNAQIVLLALQGARLSWSDDHLALNVQDFVKLVLQPLLKNKNLN